MTKGPWKYQKAAGHHHVLMGEESLDVNTESDARAIALVPSMVEFLKRMQRSVALSTNPIRDYEQLIGQAKQILNKLEKK